MKEKWKSLRERDPELPLMEDLLKGRLYRLTSRNLSCGVYDGDGGFMGIREQFGKRYIDVELHWDKSKNFGTVSSVIDMEIDTDIPIDFRSEELFQFLEENGK